MKIIFIPSLYYFVRYCITIFTIFPGCHSSFFFFFRYLKSVKYFQFGLTEDMRADFERIMADSDMQVDTFDFHTGDVNLVG